MGARDTEHLKQYMCNPMTLHKDIFMVCTQCIDNLDFFRGSYLQRGKTHKMGETIYKSYV